MNTKHEELTAGERRYLEHARRARSAGLPLSEYCRSIGLSPHTLYSMRRQMRRKGALEPVGAERDGTGQTPTVRRGSDLVAVRVLPPSASTAPSSTGGMVCRLRTPSGWVIECGTWPPSEWLAQCLAGGDDAAR